MKKAKKTIISVIVFLLCSICILCINIKVSANNNVYDISASDSRSIQYLYLFSLNSYESGSATIISTDYKVMGVSQTTKQSVVVDNGQITFNFLNGDTQTYTINNNYLYFYVIDLGANKEYYGYSVNYDFANNKPLFDIFTHSATYTQDEITSMHINTRYLVQYDTWGTGHDVDNGLMRNYNNMVYNGYIKNNVDGYVYDEKNNSYTQGYYTGLEDGEAGKSPLTRVWEIIGGVFNAVANVMSIELFPSIPVGVFFLVPLVFGAVGFIFWIWKRGG